MKRFLIFFILCAICLTMCVSATSVEVEKEFNFGQWLKDNITPERITAIFTTLFSSILTIVVVKLGKMLTKSKEINASEIEKLIKQKIDDNFKEASINTLTPVVNEIKTLQESVRTTIKGIALLQDGTPQSKLAMFDLIEKTGLVDVETIIECKNDIQAEIDKKEQIKIETKKQLKQIEKASLPVD